MNVFWPYKHFGGGVADSEAQSPKPKAQKSKPKTQSVKAKAPEPKAQSLKPKKYFPVWQTDQNTNRGFWD